MKGLLKPLLLLLLTAALLAAVVVAVGFDRTMKAVGEAGFPSFAVLGGLVLVQQLCLAGAWAVLNRPIGHRIPFRILLEAGVTGMAVNIVTPSAYLGGEPAKVIYVGRKTGLPYQAVTGTVVLSKYLEAISFVLFFSVSSAIAIVSQRDLIEGGNLPLGIALLGVTAALLTLSCVLWISLSRRWQPLSRIVHWVRYLRPRSRFLGRLEQRTRGMESQVNAVFCEYRRTAFGAFVILMGTHVTLFLRPALFFWVGFRMGLGVGELSLIFAASQALLAFQLTPSGVGTFDGGMLGVFALLSLPAAQCAALLLCVRFWDFLLVGLGGLLGARVGAGFLAKGAPDPAS